MFLVKQTLFFFCNTFFRLLGKEYQTNAASIAWWTAENDSKMATMALSEIDLGGFCDPHCKYYDIVDSMRTFIASASTLCKQ